MSKNAYLFVVPTCGTSCSGDAMARDAADVAAVDEPTAFADTPDERMGRVVLSPEGWDKLCALIGMDPSTGLPSPTDGGAS